MQVDPYMVLGSGVVGLLVALTGAGGGALMTPMLILLFSVKPSTAISSDLVAAVVMRPVSAVVHFGKKTVNLRLVGWLVLGSVPMALVGSYLLHLMGHSPTAEGDVEHVLGAALLIGAAAMVLRYVLDRKNDRPRNTPVRQLGVRPVGTVLIGAVGGLIVGFTSVGSGSLMIVLLLFLYPRLGAKHLVGTDLAQAVPLTLAAAVGALMFNSIAVSVTGSLIIGSVPGVIVGSFLSSRAPDRFIRPIITFVIFASGLKYAGVGTTELGWSLCGVAMLGALYFLSRAKPWLKESTAQKVSPLELDREAVPLGQLE